MKATLAVHTFNEAAALERLLLSSLHAAPLFDEWVVLDHRSNDDTQARLDELEAVLAAYGVTLKRLHEARDLSRRFTFADVRTATIKAASHETVMLADADFIFGEGFAQALYQGIDLLTRPGSDVAAIAFPVPVVWDHLATDPFGRVTSHGRVWVHGAKARIHHRDRCRYRQTQAGGKWEKLIRTDPRAQRVATTTNAGGVLISANVKSPERLELRRTMTMFMQDAVQGRQGDRTWLQAVEEGRTRNMPAYRYGDVDLRGTPLNLASVDLS
ncbi:MAG TPA: glycosyltransferase [Trueperaceae bacterium]